MADKPMFTFMGILGIPSLITQGEERAYAVFEVARGEALPTPEAVSDLISQGQIMFMVPSMEGFISIAVGPEDYDLFRVIDEAYVQMREGGGGPGEERPKEKNN